MSRWSNIQETKEIASYAAKSLIDPTMIVKEQTLGLHALNPFVMYNSSPRSYMMSSHISQAVCLINGDEKIIQSGVEYQLAQNTFSVKALDDLRVIKVIPKYNVMGGIDKINSYLIIGQNIENQEIDYIEVPWHFSLHQTFGFKYKWSKTINNLFPNDIIPKDTILADSPAVRENNGYAFGVNANMALMTLPETSEDSVIISEELAEKLSYNIFETRVIEYGTDYYPLNMYGDDKVYKPFPDIGETVNDDSIIMCLRKFSDRYNLANMSKEDTREFDINFDKPTYVRAPGEQIETNGGFVASNGIVTDVKVIHSPRHKKELMLGTSNNVMKYAHALEKYYKDIILAVEDAEAEHYRMYKSQTPMSAKMKRLMLDAYALVNRDSHKIKYNHRNEQTDIIRIEICVCYKIKVGVSSKISDLAGSKGIVTAVWDKSRMPVDSAGNRADIIMDPSSIPSRMNIGRPYEQYFNAISRQGKRIVSNMINNRDVDVIEDNEIDSIFSHILELTRIFGTEQYDFYSKADIDTKREIIKETIEKELHLIYKFNKWFTEPPREAYEIVLDVQDTIYEPPLGKVTYNDLHGKPKVSETDILIAPVYTILLGRTAENYLSTASPKVNHFGFVIGVSNNAKHNAPWRNNPVRTISETEGRLYVAYAKSPVGPAELSDRAKSVPTHRHIYENILKADQPTNIHRVVDRNKIPYGEDSANVLVNNILAAAGVELEYVHDSNKVHTYKGDM